MKKAVDANTQTKKPRAAEKKHKAAQSIVCLKDLDKEEIGDIVFDSGQKPYRATQLCDWLYAKRAASFDDMTNIPAEFRKQLAESYSVDSLVLVSRAASADGTRKYVFGLADGGFIESVVIPDNDRATICVSTQAGCAMNCRFCKTGERGLKRNLLASEIIDQLIFAMRNEKKISNIVFMGMGEPLANLENFGAAVRNITAPWGLAMSPRRLTFSTSGLTEMFDAAADALPPIGLAVSLNAPDDATRAAIMPVAKKHPVKELVEAAAMYSTRTTAELTFEYVLLAGVNDSAAHARKLASLLKGVRCKVNLISFNPFPGCAFARPSEKIVAAFQNYLKKMGVQAFLRASRGADIGAACGQLSGVQKKQKQQ